VEKDSVTQDFLEGLKQQTSNIEKAIQAVAQATAKILSYNEQGSLAVGEEVQRISQQITQVIKDGMAQAARGKALLDALKKDGEDKAAADMKQLLARRRRPQKEEAAAAAEDAAAKATSAAAAEGKAHADAAAALRRQLADQTAGSEAVHRHMAQLQAAARRADVDLADARRALTDARAAAAVAEEV
jgi:hypothetical protein